MTISSITDNCILAIVCSQHTWLVNRNRLCCYRSSHTFSIADLFAACRTHLVKLNRFCSLGSMQIVHPSELYAIYRTHLHLSAHFCCSASSQTVHWAEPYGLHHTHNKNLNRVWCIRHRKCFAPFLTVFYNTICDYCIAHSFVEGFLIVVLR